MTKRKALANTKLLPSTKKRSNFDQVASSICPHDGAKLGDEIRGKGIGVTRVCESCQHRWYLNKKIKTCKCLSCSVDKRKAKSVADEASANCKVDSTNAKCYNLDVLGNRLVVGQRTLDPLAVVRIHLPQP